MNNLDQALTVLDAGGLIIVADDEHRENEGDLIGLADRASPDMINFMITQGRGLVCFPMIRTLAERLALSLMVPHTTDPFRTAFTQSIDAHPRFGLSTGISAGDRARTIQVALRDDAVAEDLVRPGHVFPLIAQDGGVLVRRGHTEAAVDLAQMAGHQPAGVIVEILRPDGMMARRDDLHAMAKAFQLPYLTVSDIALARASVS
ncbi:3,4-dihydroxy-2-butanone-4-phosphate synthase [Sulfobacillus thermosulfidooxidans]|uniref:3,4-dihydroxy-2-butanone-4-phosphate synthase n=1 Tax=Sulfobacillus thermosulfidooxidans TaxID=28034 RepID=UPI0009EB6FD7|nr:3,4-dihydroxy-2-butanone-4-phosphate synthase [Sulfobacillus thermosulfidooxidans]